MDRQEQKQFYSTYATGHDAVDRQYFTDITDNLVQNLTGYLTDGCNQTMENCQNGYISHNETVPYSPSIANNSGHSILTPCNTGHSCHQLESSVAQETVTNPFSNYISTGASYTNSPTPGTTMTTMSMVSPQLYNALQASSANAYNNWTQSNDTQSENWTTQQEFIIKTEDSDLDTDNLFSGCFDSDSASVFSSFDETDQLSQFYESDHSHCNEDGGVTQAERHDMLDGTRARTSTPQLNSAKVSYMFSNFQIKCLQKCLSFTLCLEKLDHI